ncbi:MAG TPA: hypothetical protein VGH65_11205 [Verrucomicrobiaceae bacterium]|jgi:hypothetical protein
MHFPRFWAKGQTGNLSCWRWSDESLVDAQCQASDAADKLAERFQSGERLKNRYGYASAALREPVLREIKDESGAVSAAVTRNAYGCFVLNCARVMFVDVDLPEPAARPGLLDFLGKLFGKPAPAKKTGGASEAEIADKSEAWIRGHPGWGWRTYRTRAGWRLLATHDVIAPDDGATAEVFDALGADPLYRRLCSVQKSFRARLSPKAWRCKLEAPGARWPWENPEKEAQFKKWDEAYQRVAADFATCEFLSACGGEKVHPEVAQIVQLHDEATRAHSKLPLA